MNNKKILYPTASIIIILDQIIKLLVIHFLKIQEEIIVIPNFFSLYYTKNTGAAFSILQDQTLFLIIISVIFILFIHNYIKKEEITDTYMQFLLGLVIGGIFGNLIDRIIHRSVIDYLLFHINEHYFPVFNLADSAICIGVLFIIVIMIKESRIKKDERNVL